MAFLNHIFIYGRLLALSYIRWFVVILLAFFYIRVCAQQLIMIQIYTRFQVLAVKAGFHMIADRRPQITMRSAIVYDDGNILSSIVCDPAITIADDRRR